MCVLYGRIHRPDAACVRLLEYAKCRTKSATIFQLYMRLLLYKSIWCLHLILKWIFNVSFWVLSANERFTLFFNDLCLFLCRVEMVWHRTCASSKCHQCECFNSCAQLGISHNWTKFGPGELKKNCKNPMSSSLFFRWEFSRVE